MTQFFFHNTNQSYDPLMRNSFRSFPDGQWESELTETLEAEFTEMPPLTNATEKAKRSEIIGPFAILALLFIGAMPLFLSGAVMPSISADTNHTEAAQQLVNPL